MKSFCERKATFLGIKQFPERTFKIMTLKKKTKCQKQESDTGAIVQWEESLLAIANQVQSPEFHIVLRAPPGIIAKQEQT